MRKTNWGIVNRKSSDKARRVFTFDPEQGQNMIKACPAKGTIMVAPIFDWEDEDVWAYIRSRGLPYCSLYDEGFTRLGCIGCPMAGREGREQQFKRWPRFKQAYLIAFDRMLKERRQKEKWSKTKCNWKTAQDVFDWWISDQPFSADDTETLFEELMEEGTG